MGWLVRLLYNIVLPPAVLLAAPAWIVRMARRGGLDARLWERLGVYDRAGEFEPVGVVYVHAVSVGEVLIALRFIRRWRAEEPAVRIVLAATTATGYRLACEQAPEGVRVIYSPIDLPVLIRRLFRRFEPRVIVLVDSELWPNLLHHADRLGVPVALVNARLSPRSARRYERFAALTGPVLSQLKLVCAQAEEHVATWRRLGIAPDRVVAPGSIKFDPDGAGEPARREEFETMLRSFGPGRPVVLAASSHLGEEALVASAARAVPGALPVLLPRHAERRAEVRASLEEQGFEVVLRSAFRAPENPAKAVLVVDSTGELRDWTAHADVAVIGKSFRARGGQNPTEAIAAGVPVVCGPHMENFEPLVTQLRNAGAVRTVGEDELGGELRELFEHPRERKEIVKRAREILDAHRGATGRSVARVRELAAG